MLVEESGMRVLARSVPTFCGSLWLMFLGFRLFSIATGSDLWVAAIWVGIGHN